MNVAVINLKNISKNFIRIIIGAVIIILVIRTLIVNISFLEKCFFFERCSLIYTSLYTNTNNVKFKIDNIKVLNFFSPLTIAFNNEAKVEETVIKNTNMIEDEVIISKNANIESVSDRNIAESYNITYTDVKIRNQSDYTLSDEIFSQDDMQLTNTKKVLIYHTHTCESYTPSEKYNYTMTGNYRTTDNNFNVVRVGAELEKYLTQKGFEVIHDSSYNDYPSYNGSYERSLESIESILKDNQDIQIVIDLHRDAIGDGSSYGPTVKINGESVAQLMFVIGTDGGGLEHPNWKQNIKMAVKIQSKANEIYPGLFRPIIIRNSRYNQHVKPGACIIEVGATGNTLDECILSMQCLANVLEETF